MQFHRVWKSNQRQEINQKKVGNLKHFMDEAVD
jgi:hypothetical protein